MKGHRKLLFLGGLMFVATGLLLIGQIEGAEWTQLAIVAAGGFAVGNTAEHVGASLRDRYGHLGGE